MAGQAIPPGNPRLRLLDFTAPLGEDPIHPRVGELAARDGRHVVRLGLLPLAKAPHEERGVFPRDDHDTALVANDDVPRMNDDTAALYGVVDLAGAPMEGPDRRRPSGIDRVTKTQDACEIPDISIDDASGDAPVARLGADEVAQDSVHRGTARVDDEDVIWGCDIERFVDHEVVTGEDLDRAGRAQDPLAPRGETSDRRGHRIEAVESVGYDRRLELADGCHQLGGRAGDGFPDSKAGPWVHFGSHRFAGHGNPPWGRPPGRGFPPCGS